MSEVECPYCGEEQYIEGESIDTNRLWEKECAKCNKAFLVESDITIDHTGHKADCLNSDGDAHDYSTHVSPGDYWKCSVCHKRKGGE